MTAQIGIIVVILAILFILAPIGIWNRLIKIHRDNKVASERTHALLERIATAMDGRAPTHQRARTTGHYSHD